MSSEYRCGQCKREYSREMYDYLDRRPVNPEDEDPMVGSGYERVCECGAGFHTDKWQLRDTIERDGQGVTISTVNLIIPHGLDHDKWYETCIFGRGNRVVERYICESDAEEGHSSIVTAVEEGEYDYV